MRDPPLILAVDDTPENLEILQVRLEANGYEIRTAADGEEALEAIRSLKPDLVLLDIMMPKRDGISVLREMRSDPDLQTMPVIVITAKSDSRDVVEALEAGGNDYLSKPFEHAALLARVRSMLRQKALHDTIELQARRLQSQADELASLNRSLEERVARQVEELDRIGRLRRFLPPQVAELVMAAGDSGSLLKSHRREVTVVFCDLRGFTAFAEMAEPEEVMAVLDEYHACLGDLIGRYEGTLERFMGDGLLVVFNDPISCEDHTERAVRMSLAMRDAIEERAARWQRHGYALGFGIGIARGHATIGRIGFDQRMDYAVIGTVANLAARLCGEAEAGRILISQRALAAIEPRIEYQDIGQMQLKGFHRPVPIFEILRWRD